MAELTANARPQSHRAWEAAQRVIPGGVNSPVRAFTGVGGEPVFIRSASGSRITDIDGNDYVDYVGSWGPLILGHAPTEVIDAVCEVARGGTSFGAPTEGEVKLADHSVLAGTLCKRTHRFGSSAGPHFVDIWTMPKRQVVDGRLLVAETLKIPTADPATADPN